MKSTSRVTRLKNYLRILKIVDETTVLDFT